MRHFLRALAAVLALFGAAPIEAGEPVHIELPVRARLDLTGYRSLTVIPFITGSTEGAAALPDLDRQLMRYLARTVERETDLDVSSLVVDLPTFEPQALAANLLFWQSLGERTGSDLILAGAVDFDLQDRSGYVTREFVSDQDGRTYFAQVLVEQAGIELDLLVWVVDGRSGRVLLADNFKDFQSFRGESLDPLSGLFANLAMLEDRLIGIFKRRTVTAERLLQ